MAVQTIVEPKWATLTVWGIVNAVNVLQAAGFLSRLQGRGMETNRLLGCVIIALSIPALAALVALMRAKAGWLQWSGTVTFLAFVALLIVVDYVRPVEFRSPMRAEILVPFLLLFFGSILLMGLPMYGMDRRLWLVTVGTTILLLGAMGIAMRAGVG